MQPHRVLAVLACCACSSDPPQHHAACDAFAERVTACAVGSEQFGPLPEPDRSNVKRIAYEVCTGRSTDEKAKRWYGDVAAKLACTHREGSCDAFQQCLDDVDARAGSATPRK